MKFADALKKATTLFDSNSFFERIKDEDPTMIKYLPLLQKINKSGFLTTQSQAGNRTKGFSSHDGEPYELLERAFITGFMLEKDAVKFIKNMAVHTDKNAIYVPVCKETPASLDIPLTIVRRKSDIRIETHMSTSLPKSTEASFRKMVHLNKSEKVVFIFCWDSKWCRSASDKNGLFTEVHSILKM